jgi:2-phosphosulfolactate phosphatase
MRVALSASELTIGDPQSCNDGPMPELRAGSPSPHEGADPGVYGQHDFVVRFDWGPDGAATLAGGVDVVVVVDVLSFTTAVSVATARGAVVFPYPWQEGAAEFAAAKGATLAGTRDEGGLSLSPVSLTALHLGDRIALRSPNGATICSRLFETGARVIAGCLRNASAVSAFVAKRAWSVAVIAGGERWPGAASGIRPCLEDLLGAGAILSGLAQEQCSPEALAAVAAYRRFEGELTSALMNSVGGRELSAWGYREDVQIAAALDADSVVPALTKEGAFAGTG